MDSFMTELKTTFAGPVKHFANFKVLFERSNFATFQLTPNYTSILSTEFGFFTKRTNFQQQDIQYISTLVIINVDNLVNKYFLKTLFSYYL
jgi:hypothetical protein